MSWHFWVNDVLASVSYSLNRAVFSKIWLIKGFLRADYPDYCSNINSLAWPDPAARQRGSGFKIVTTAGNTTIWISSSMLTEKPPMTDSNHSHRRCPRYQRMNVKKLDNYTPRPADTLLTLV